MKELQKYNEKRNFKKTKEPVGKKQKSAKKLHFVVQHHMARKDHFDVRLEWNGVLKSWAVPKGPSYNPKDRRLAVKVEDHPLNYRNFEGTIPKGEYGGGTVMLWDEGYWEPITSKVSFKKPIKFLLHGKRLKGHWTLIPYKEENWLLIKEKDEEQYQDIKKFTMSIRSGKTMEEIAGKIILTNPKKLIDKKNRITKKDIFSYYEKVAKRMLPYIKNRLISTIRSPEGIEKEKFYKKHFENIDNYLGKIKIINDKGKKEDYYYIKDEQGLLSEVQMNSYEFHIWGSNVPKIKKPNVMIFDLDPDEKLSLEKVREGVKDLKRILDELNLPAFLKTSGGKGYHVVVPLPMKNWDTFRDFAKNIAKLMEKKWPDKYTSNMSKKKRKNKIFIDWVRNTEKATSVAPYSVRLRKNIPVSMPIKWSELDKIKPNEITMKEAIKRINRKDPWQELQDFLLQFTANESA